MTATVPVREKRQYTKRDHSPKFCKCGCGEQVNFRSKGWRPGHNSASQHLDPAFTAKCVTGFLAATERKKLVKTPPQPCKCGCGQLTKAGKEWIRFHSFAVANQQKIARKAKRLKEIGPAKLCKCGCGEMCKVGRTWKSHHNSGLTPLTYTPESKAKQRENGRATVAKKIANGYQWSEERRAAAISLVKSEEHRLKNSAGIRKAIAEGRWPTDTPARRAGVDKMMLSGKCGGHKHHKHGKYFSVKMQKTFSYDSSWELAHLEALEASDDVEAYARIPVRLVYTADDDNKRHRYYPDFGIKYKTGEYVIEEIKPLALTKYKRNPRKLEAGFRYCQDKGYQYRVITSLEDCKVISR